MSRCVAICRASINVHPTRRRGPGACRACPTSRPRSPNDDLSREWQFGIAVLGPGDALITEHRTPLALHDTEVAEGEQLGVLVALTLSGLVVQDLWPAPRSIVRRRGRD